MKKGWLKAIKHSIDAWESSDFRKALMATLRCRLKNSRGYRGPGSVTCASEFVPDPH